MVNYGKTKIYKIWSPLGDKIYIGATTKEYLSQRMDEHRSKYKRYLKLQPQTNCTSVLIFDEYGVENCYIELIEAKECNSKDEQTKIEGKYIREMNCVNKNIPDRSDKEKKEYYEEYYKKNKINLVINNKQYYENNKDKINEQCKKYRIDNKEKLKELSSIKCMCICGSMYRISNKKRHENTHKHLNFIQQPQ